jgi:Family of unknown function (DUF6311)
MKQWIPWVLATIIVILIYHVCYGLATLQPTNISWLMTVRHDWGTHYLGWAFYKNEPWHFPLGRVNAYNYPVGTNVGFTDSIPLMAMFFKLFARFLPDDFQYFGIWLLLCDFLTAYFTIRLLRLFKVNWFITLAAVIFVTANPVLVYRGMHPALCAQWLLIASIYVYFLKPDETRTNRILLYQFLLLMASALINPYLCWMVLGFTLATPARLCFFDKALHVKYFFVYLAVSLLSMLVLWYLTGLIDFSKKEDLGVGGAYGLYALNLNSLFNSFGYSSILRQLPWVSPYQYEGYAYLGLGMMVLLLALLLSFAYHRLTRKTTSASLPAAKTALDGRPAPLSTGSLIPLLVLTVAYTILAVTLIFTYNERVLFRIPAPSFFIKLEEIFRACARFFWTPYYLIVLFTIIGVAKWKAHPVIPSAVIFAALVLQLYDIRILLTSRKPTYGSYVPPMDNKSWLTLMSQFDEILFIPPFQSPAIRSMDYQDFSFLALKARKPVNLAYVARADSRAMQEYADSLNRMVEVGNLSPKALYITNASSLEEFTLPIQSGAARLNTLDGCFYIFSKDLNNPLIDSLSKKLNSPRKGKLDSALTALGNRNEFRAAAIPATESKSFRYNLESIRIVHDILTINGWFVKDSASDDTGDSLMISLNSGNTRYWAPALSFDRPDVAGAFPKAKIHRAGIHILAFTDSVQKGSYQIGIVIRTADGRYSEQVTQTEMKVKYPEYPTPIKIARLPAAGPIDYDLNLEDKDSLFTVAGWAALKNQDAGSNRIHLILKGNQNTLLLEAEPILRPDVTAYFKNKYNLDHSGYTIKIAKRDLPKDKYQFGFIIDDAANHKQYAMMTDRGIDIH